MRFYKFEEKIDEFWSHDEHIPSCDFFNLTRENYSDELNQFSCVKNTAEFQSLFATGLFSTLSSVPANYLSEYLVTKENTKTYSFLYVFVLYQFQRNLWLRRQQILQLMREVPA